MRHGETRLAYRGQSRGAMTGSRSSDDLSSGFEPIAEQALEAAPRDVPFYAENFLFALYDPTADVSLWTHLGTWPADFGIWEDELLCALPGGDETLWSYSYHRTPQSDKPRGANLSYRCIEPFRRWQVTYDGVCVRTPAAEMRTARVARRRAGDGPLRARRRVRLTRLGSGRRGRRGHGRAGLGQPALPADRQCHRPHRDR